MNVDEFERTPLHYLPIEAPREQHRERVAQLVAEGYDPNKKDMNGWVALHFAAQECSAEAASALILAGARVDEPDNGGNTPLWRAVFSSRGNGEVIRVLLAAGADRYKANLRGVSPWMLALRIANYDVRKFFE